MSSRTIARRAGGTQRNLPIARSEWMVPAGLIFMMLIPALAGGMRLFQLASDAEVTPENQRFFDMPVPVIIHIFAVTTYGSLGAFQFAPRFRIRFPKWHRRAGWFLFPMALASTLSGLWMTFFYPWPENDGVVLYMERIAVGSWSLLALGMAYREIRRRNFKQHGKWMLRAYAIGMGAGTQVFTHIPYVIIMGEDPTEAPRAVLMGAGWLINFLVAEWIIRQELTSPKGAARAKSNR